MGKKQKLRCQHDNTWFDRSICAEPCGDMHTSCTDCGYIFGGCYWLNRDAEPAELSFDGSIEGPYTTTILAGNLAGIQKGSMKLKGFYRPHEVKSVVQAELADWEKKLIDSISLESRPIPNLREDRYGDIRACDCGVRDDSPCCCPVAFGDEALEAVSTRAVGTTHEDIDGCIVDTLAGIQYLNETKGREYATETDALANFKNRAQQMGITPGQVWGIFYGKHADAVFSYIRRGGEVLSEPIEGRIDDAILYLVLLKALILEGSA